MEPLIGVWRETLRLLIEKSRLRYRDIVARASEYGPKISESNLSSFMTGHHPQGDAISAKKLEQIALALGHRLCLVSEDSVILSKKDVRTIRKMLSSIGKKYEIAGATKSKL